MSSTIPTIIALTPAFIMKLPAATAMRTLISFELSLKTCDIALLFFAISCMYEKNISPIFLTYTAILFPISFVLSPRMSTIGISARDIVGVAFLFVSKGKISSEAAFTEFIGTITSLREGISSPIFLGDVTFVISKGVVAISKSTV